MSEIQRFLWESRAQNSFRLSGKVSSVLAEQVQTEEPRGSDGMVKSSFKTREKFYEHLEKIMLRN